MIDARTEASPRSDVGGRAVTLGCFRRSTWFTTGFVVWLVATLVLGRIGDLFLERGTLVYAAFAITVCGGFVGLFAVLARLAGLTRPAALPAAVAFSSRAWRGKWSS